MRVLIACECSGVVRRAFQARGHTAWSCDLKPADDGEDAYHLQMDALEAIKGRKPDLVIAHPPCTRICNSGVLRLYKGGKKINGIDLDRWAAMRDGAYFFDCFRRFYPGPLCIENPVMHGHAFDLLSEATQMMDRQSVQPWQFGDDASKRTVLWLRGLPRLKLDPAKFVAPRRVCLCGHTYSNDLEQCPACHKDRQNASKPRWANQTDGGQNKLAPSPTRAARRAVTYAGIANAMAEQWGKS